MISYCHGTGMEEKITVEILNIIYHMYIFANCYAHTFHYNLKDSYFPLQPKYFTLQLSRTEMILPYMNGINEICMAEYFSNQLLLVSFLLNFFLLTFNCKNIWAIMRLICMYKAREVIYKKCPDDLFDFYFQLSGIMSKIWHQ